MATSTMLTEKGKKYLNHEVDGTIANRIQHSAFAFLVQATVKGCVVELHAEVLNMKHTLGTIVASHEDEAGQAAHFINEIAHGQDSTKPEYKIVAAHCVAAACPENKYRSQWEFEKRETGIETTNTKTLTLGDIIDLIH